MRPVYQIAKAPPLPAEAVQVSVLGLPAVVEASW
jgi:hypothetical protein